MGKPADEPSGDKEADMLTSKPSYSYDVLVLATTIEEACCGAGLSQIIWNTGCSHVLLVTRHWQADESN